MNIEFGNNIRTWNLVCGIALAIIAIITIYDVVVPKADANRVRNQRSREVSKLEAQLRADSARLEKLRAANPSIWDGQLEDVTPRILAEATRLASSNGVNLKSFRPQNPVTDGETMRANFVMLVDGSFPKVAALIRAIDSPASRIGLSVVQISSADQESDTVNATLGIIAYLKAPAPPKRTNSSNSQTSGGNGRGQEEK